MCERERRVKENAAVAALACSVCHVSFPGCCNSVIVQGVLCVGVCVVYGVMQCLWGDQQHQGAMIWLLKTNYVLSFLFL